MTYLRYWPAPALVVAASLAAMLAAACTQPEPVVVVVTATPEVRADDKLARNVASPVADTPTPPPTGAPVPANTPTLHPTNTPATASTLTPRPINTPAAASTLIPTRTPAPVPTDTPIPTNTPTPVPTSTPTPTNTPVPVVRLVLGAESSVVGYWSDGTADVEVTATLRNEGTLRLEGERELTATCIAHGDERRDCREALSLSLPDGFAPAYESFTLRLPMGATTLMFDYGESEPLILDIDVPERIVGVDREVWECYADRPQQRVEIEGEFFDGCGGWSTKTVEKWLNDVPVKVWATGDVIHIATLETVLTELAPVLALEFEWVDAEEEADFKAFVGVPPARASDLGFDPTSVHWWGFAGANVNGGEVTSGYMVIWQLDEDAVRSGSRPVKWCKSASS